jgi:hypothetical protein
MLSDVTGDGDVNIADVTALIDYVLDGDSTNFFEVNADVNQDGNIGIADVTAIIDMILN